MSINKRKAITNTTKRLENSQTGKMDITAYAAPRLNVTSGEVGEALKFRIIQGEYTRGSKLPTCRALMQQMGVNKNTVSKAFQSLEEQGFVKTVAGKGTFVTYDPFTTRASETSNTFEDNINRAIWQARAAGLGREEVTELFNRCLQIHYDSASVRAMLLECNFKEAQQFSRELSEITNIKIQPVVINDFLVDPESYINRYNVIIATFSHLHEIEEGLNAYDKSNLIAVNTAVIADSLIQIARIPKGSKTAVITTSSPTITQLTGFILAYNSSLVLSSCLENEDEKLARLIKESDWIIATQTSYPKVSQLAGDKPVVAAEFKIDQQSLASFSRKVNSLDAQTVVPSLLKTASTAN